MTDICEHLAALDTTGDPVGASPGSTGCVDCLAIGGRWLHLRRCLACGHVGCCDSSPNRHASAHARGSAHAVIQSFEPGEEWVYCYPDDEMAEFDGLPPSPAHP